MGRAFRNALLTFRTMLATFVTVVVTFAVTVCPQTHAQDASDAEPGVVYLLEGEPFDEYGIDLEPLDDINGDGTPDFAVGAVDGGSTDGEGAGYLHIHSGRDGTILRTLRGTEPEQRFGVHMVTMTDVSGDGLRDLVVVSNQGMMIVNPTTGDEIQTVNADPDTIENSVVDAGDIDGDGSPDLLIGSPLYSSRGIPSVREGKAYAYSLSRNEVIWERLGELNEIWGYARLAIDDTTGDGVRELIVLEDAARQFLRIHILDGRTGETLHRMSDNRMPHFGAKLRLLGDLNGDGYREFAFRAHFPEDGWWHGRGTVFIHDGRTFELLRQHIGVDREFRAGFDGDVLGHTLSDAGDTDGDGVSDYLIGTERAAGGLTTGVYRLGKLYLHSGRTGAPIATYMGRIGFHPYLGKVAPLGDVDGDGRAEFLVGSHQNEAEDSAGTTTGFHGQVRVVRFDPTWPSFVRGDADGDLQVNLTDAYLIAAYFSGVGTEPPCLQALDADASGDLAGADVFLLLRHIFLGEIAPATPYPECSRVGGFLRDELPCAQSTCTP